MRSVGSSNKESMAKKVRSDGCRLCSNHKCASKRDPVTGFWYCQACLFDVRPDLASSAKGQKSAPTPTNWVVRKTPLAAVSFRSPPHYTPRCFACFSRENDVAEYTCGKQLSASCCAVRLCSRCRAAHDIVRCPHCWASAKFYNGCYLCLGFIGG
jgi:hypothetical protein